MGTLIGILMDAFFIGLLIWCSYMDIRKRMVSNVSVILMLCSGIAHMVLMGLDENTWWIYPTGIVFAVPFFIVWLRGSMGAGDVKLVLAISLYLGLLNMIAAFILIVPVLLGLMVRSWRKNQTLKYRIPFTPVLSFGAAGSVLIGYLYALAGI